MVLEKLKRKLCGEPEDKQNDDKPEMAGPCNETGHIWKTYNSSYFARVIKLDKYVKVYRKDYQECVKCGRVSSEKTEIERLRINKEENKLEEL